MNWFRRWQEKLRETRILRDCGCICWCNCGRSLNDQPGGQYESDGDVYRYQCACGATPAFWFGAPVPIRLREETGQ